MRTLFGAWVVVVALGAASTGRAVVPITSCNQLVPLGQRGVLQNDIDCRWSCTGDRSIGCDRDSECEGKGFCEGESLLLGRDAVLELNGHRLSAPLRGYGVVCAGRKARPGRCVVKGPGRIDRGLRAVMSLWSDVLVTRVELLGEYGAVSSQGHVEVRHSTIPRFVSNAVSGSKGITLVDVEGEPEWIESRGDIELRDVRLPGPVEIYTNGAVLGRDVVFDDRLLLRARDVRLRRAVGTDAIAGSSILARRHLHLVDSTVHTIAAGREPRLVRSTCEQSFVADASATWGVCVND